jgi:hypothetical protein
LIVQYNLDSILAYIDAAGSGFYGRVMSGGNAMPGVSVLVDGGDISTKTDSDGYYHRILLPGNYSVSFMANGYQEYSDDITIPDINPPLLKLDVELKTTPAK